MSRKFAWFSAIVSIIFLAGCIQIVPPATATQAAAAQVQVSTELPDVIYVTATPDSPQVIIVTATPGPTDTATSLPTATATPTADPTPRLKMADTRDQGDGTIYVSWNADGDFSSGFQVLWSVSNQSPTFPADSSTYVSDPVTRSITFRADAGRTYYVRVCRYVNGSCDVYSDVKTVTMAGSVQNPQPLNRPPFNNNNNSPSYTYPTATAGTVSPYITITGMRSTGNGAAVLYWQAYGEFDSGFKILYSTASSQPTYGDYSYYSASGSSRSVAVSGTAGSTYYFRICRFTGSSCDTYSNVYSFTFQGYATGTPGYPPPVPRHP
jgi:hypothetical protein